MKIATLVAFFMLMVANMANASVRDTIQVVLLAGQSNMEGSGLYNMLSKADKSRIEAISSRVLISNKGENPIPLSYTYSEYQKAKLGSGEVFGPELFIGLTLAEANPEKEYLFIKLAQGGTALYCA